MAAHVVAAASTAAALFAASAGTGSRGPFARAAPPSRVCARPLSAPRLRPRSLGSLGLGTAAAPLMGNKPRLTCASCGASFKRKTSTDKSSPPFCGVACAAAGPSSGYGDVPPAFAGGGGGAAPSVGYDSDRSAGSASGSFSWEREAGDGKRRNKRKRKKQKKRPTPPSRPVEDDPACVAVLNLLDARCRVVASPGPALDDAMRRCASVDVLAVDCEGVAMSRVGPITLLQVAAGRDVFLFDVQALGTEHLFGGVDDAPRTPLRDALENPHATKLMFDCRVDSDALYHQHGVKLAGVFDVQLADVAARRRRSLAVTFLAGMPKCAQRHLSAGAAAAEAALAALDGPAAAREGAEPPITAEAVSRVTEHLKTKVKALYAPDRGGDSGLWALRPISVDARRYAALDVWLLGEIHDAMTSSESLDEEWTGRVVRASEARVVEYRDAKEPVLQFRDPERAVAPDI